MSGRSQASAIVTAVLDAWNARDLERFTALLTEDVYWHDLGMLHPPALGRDQCVASARAFSARSPTSGMRSGIRSASPRTALAAWSPGRSRLRTRARSNRPAWRPPVAP